ncbi:hypothetical protein PR048_008078 [Dryococelus australis]|uniref:Uncharacterized protein n=1 Tax=Dryococelus australis TaxID=614101 RepID=A0ABQ9HW32_9NEOP|nr:hypothetical protein PR048_008078 [Dryococelus australis]
MNLRPALTRSVLMHSEQIQIKCRLMKPRVSKYHGHVSRGEDVSPCHHEERSSTLERAANKIIFLVKRSSKAQELTRITRPGALPRLPRGAPAEPRGVPTNIREAVNPLWCLFNSMGEFRAIEDEQRDKATSDREVCDGEYQAVECAARRLDYWTRCRHGGNTARLARRSDEALGVRVTVARIAPSLLDLGLRVPTGVHPTLKNSRTLPNWDLIPESFVTEFAIRKGHHCEAMLGLKVEVKQLPMEHCTRLYNGFINASGCPCNGGLMHVFGLCNGWLMHVFGLCNGGLLYVFELCNGGLLHVFGLMECEECSPEVLTCSIATFCIKKYVRKLPVKVQTTASVDEQKRETPVTKCSERPFSMFKLKLNFGKRRRVSAAVRMFVHSKLQDTKANGGGITCSQRLYIGHQQIASSPATAVRPMCGTVATHSTDRRSRVRRAALPWISSPSFYATCRARRDERAGKRDISEKTNGSASSSGLIFTCENPLCIAIIPKSYTRASSSVVPPVSLTLHFTDARSPQTSLPVVTLVASRRFTDTSLNCLRTPVALGSHNPPSSPLSDTDYSEKFNTLKIRTTRVSIGLFAAGPGGLPLKISANFSRHFSALLLRWFPRDGWTHNHSSHLSVARPSVSHPSVSFCPSVESDSQQPVVCQSYRPFGFNPRLARIFHPDGNGPAVHVWLVHRHATTTLHVSIPGGVTPRFSLVGNVDDATVERQVSTYTRQKAKSKYRSRIRLERASQKQSGDTHKTPYDRVKRCRERKKKNTKASDRVNVDRSRSGSNLPPPRCESNIPVAHEKIPVGDDSGLGPTTLLRKVTDLSMGSTEFGATYSKLEPLRAISKHCQSVGNPMRSSRKIFPHPYHANTTPNR